MYKYEVRINGAWRFAPHAENVAQAVERALQMWKWEASVKELEEAAQKEIHLVVRFCG
jgi:hypothetical protein